MTLRERIQSDITAAMRSGEALRRDVLRMASNALYNAEKTARRPLSDDESIGVLTREVKTRRESVDAFRAGGRPELADKEEAEIAILREYLPSALSEAELEALVAQAVTETGASSPRDLGRVMGWLSPRTRGRADGRHVSELVARSLARADVAAHDAAH
ncbi:MAG TPA: GatB/YqeY domain-containing protein [Candidatus Dormibacteraeota bacterium]|nr:GatB/YqeY domain-containing protein [Candidatus Dormibacteraeota bacterium]